MAIFLIADSPRYYLNKDNDRVIKEFNKIAKYNGRTPLKKDEFDFSEYEVKDNDTTKHYNYFTLFKFKSLRMLTILTCIV